MKITGTIVDKNMALIGLVLKGKPVEFGMMGKQNWTVNPFSLSDAKKLIKKNDCSDFELDSNDNIVGKNNKKLSDLPMYDKKGNTVDNKITIKSAIEDNGKLVGAVILFSNGIEKKLKLSDLTLVYTYCEPVNFILKNKNDSYFITGKGETKKEDIPVANQTYRKKKDMSAKEIKGNLSLYPETYYKDNKLIPTCQVEFCMDDGIISDFCKFFDFVSYKESGYSKDIENELKNTCKYSNLEYEKLGLDEKSTYYAIRKGGIAFFDAGTIHLPDGGLSVSFSDVSGESKISNFPLFIKKLVEFRACLNEHNLDFYATQWDNYNYIGDMFEPICKKACQLLGISDMSDSKKVENVKQEIDLFMRDRLHDAFINFLSKYNIEYHTSNIYDIYKPYPYTFKSNVYEVCGKPFIKYYEPNQKYSLGYFKVIE